MMGRKVAALAALVTCFQIGSPVQAGGAALVVAQGAAPATTPAPDSNAAHDQSATTTAKPEAAKPEAAKPEAAKAPDAAPKPRAKSVLAVPACSVRYVALKISGKLNGRKWKDFRRDECGLGDINAVFPDAIAPKYSGEDPDTARMHTCADQFTANKANKANGGLKWIEKDGGYYGECVGHLKG